MHTEHRGLFLYIRTNYIRVGRATSSKRKNFLTFIMKRGAVRDHHDSERLERTKRALKETRLCMD